MTQPPQHPSPRPSKHRARKRFGQHFLTDPVVVQRLVATIQPKREEHLVEIGPGLGVLTEALLPQAGQMDAVELDRDLIPKLEKHCLPLGKLTIHSADALNFDFCSLQRDDELLRVVGNLPYNISTPLMFHLLKQAHCIRDMHFMLQKEVVDRLAASPGNRDYGRLSVMIQYHCQVTALFHVPPEAFSPPPKVDSAIVRLEPYVQKPVTVNDEATLEHVVRQSFSMRRKTLRNNLKGLLTDAQIQATGIDPAQRAETLTLEQFVSLANHCTIPSE